MRLSCSSESWPVLRPSRSPEAAPRAAARRGAAGGAGRRRPPPRRPLGHLGDEGVADLALAGADGRPLAGAQGVHGHGVEDPLLLAHHVVHHLGQRQARADGHRGVVGGDGLARLLDERADVVVDGPHHLARALHAVLLEVGEELVLLAQVVPLDLGQALDGAGERVLEASPGGAVRGLAHGLGHLAQGGRDLQHRLVLALEGVHGVAGRRRDGLVALERVGEHLHVHVAQALDLAVGHAALDELLLHGGDLRGLHVGDELLERRLDLVHALAGVQVLDDLVQRLEPRRVDGPGVGHIGHRRPLAGACLDLGGDVVDELVERHVALLRDRVERGHAAHRAAQHGVGQLLELGVVVRQVIEEEGILLEERVDGGLGGERERLRHGGHTRLHWLGLSLCGWYHPSMKGRLDVAQAFGSSVAPSTSGLRTYATAPPSGSRTVNAAPAPGRVSSPTLPPWASTMAATMARPRPAPPSWRDRDLSAR